MHSVISLENSNLKANILPMGATLTGLWNVNDPRSLVLGFDDTDTYSRTDFYAGAIVGPVANRLSNGRVVIEGNEYQLPQNEGVNTLHSGPDGLHRRIWNVETVTQTSVTLSCTLADGECGLPGERVITARYSLTGRVLQLHMTATSDRTTLMNPVHHPYWAMDDKARLQVTSSQVLEVESSNLPTGKLDGVDGTLFDLRSPSPVPKSLDHCFVLSAHKRDTLEIAAELTMPHYKLQIKTDAPGIQVYAGAWLPKIAGEQTQGWPIAPYSGVALEPQFWPDAPAHAHFPTILLPNQHQWEQMTQYVLEF
ncbi:MAG: aldose epimerase family protein [Paracoccaceae bacterium]